MTNKHTFVICAYKESPYLAQCIISLKAQSVKSRIIMVTSTPNKYITETAEKYGVALYVNPGPGGITQDWNFGLSLVKTPYATVAHQDDVYGKKYTARILERMEKSKHPIIAFSDYYELRDGKRVYNNSLLKIKRLMMLPLQVKAFAGSIFVRRRVLSLGSPICCPAVTYAMKNCSQPIFADGFRSCEDWEAWEKLSRLEGDFLYINKPLMCHRIHQDSATTAILGDNARVEENLTMYCKFWPKWIARIINYFYTKSEASNQLDGNGKDGERKWFQNGKAGESKWFRAGKDEGSNWSRNTLAQWREKIKKQEEQGTKSMKKVSLLMMTYNSKEALKTTLEAVEQQDYPNIEVVISDGGSTDGTVDVIKEYEQTTSNQVNWVSEKDGGLYDALNKDVARATGDYLLVMNDQLIDTQALSKMVSALEAGDFGGVHSDLIYASDTEVVRYWHMGQSSLYTGWLPGHPTLMLKREVYEKFGNYSHKFGTAADYEFMIRIITGGVRLAYVPEVLVRMYYGGVSTGSATGYWGSLKEGHRALTANGVHPAVVIDFLRCVRVFLQFYIKKQGVKAWEEHSKKED